MEIPDSFETPETGSASPKTGGVMRSSHCLLVCFVAGALALQAGGQSKNSSSSTKDGAKSGRRTHIKLGEITLGAGYSHSSGYPLYYPAYWWPYYDAWGPFGSPAYGWYSPIFHPGYWNGFRRGPNLGEVRLRTQSKTATVFLDGAYAGLAKDLKNMWLEPGAYDLEVRQDSGEAFQTRIYVLTGKTLKIDARPEPGKEAKP